LKQLGILFFLLFHAANGQQFYTLGGQVFDTDGQLLAIADVLLFENNSDKLLKYTVALDGEFSFGELPGGDYHIKISALGFEPFETALPLKEDEMLAIRLKPSTTALSGVEVVASKNPISYEGGNLKVDVQNPYFSSIPDPIAILSRLPNVQIGTDRESITILGKGSPLIYLGNQRISIEEFTGLSVDNMASIELINNPSSKYEAEGRAVLKVTLKKNVNQGFRGSISETASARRNFNNYTAFNSSVAKKDWTLRGNLGYNQLQQWESNSFLFEIPDRKVSVDYLVLIPKNIRVQLNGGLGLYWQWNDTDYISLNTSARLQTDDAPFFTDTSIDDRGNETLIQSQTANDNLKDYYSASLNFNKKLTNNWSLFSGFQYSGFKQVLDAEIRNSVGGNTFSLDEIRSQDYTINSFALRIDVEKTIAKNMKWETGINLSDARANAFTAIETLTMGQDTQTDFGYKEQLYSAYTSLSGEISKKATVDVGLRAEYNRAEGKVDLETTAVLSREMTNIFPKANVAITLDSIRSLNFNYGKTISRPNFARASTITAFINPFLEASGNVTLRPTLTDEISATYQKRKASFFVNYHQSNNPLSFAISYDAENDRGVLSQVNLEKQNGWYMGVTLPHTKGIWTSNNTITLNYSRLRDESMANVSAKPYLYAYTNHQLKVAKDTTLVVGAWAIGKSQEGVFTRNGLAVFEAALSKTFFKNWDCTVRFNDITRAMNFGERYALNGVIADGIYFTDGQEVAFSIKYRFGGKDISSFKNRDVDANLDRIN